MANPDGTLSGWSPARILAVALALAALLASADAAFVVGGISTLHGAVAVAEILLGALAGPFGLLAAVDHRRAVRGIPACR